MPEWETGTRDFPEPRDQSEEPQDPLEQPASSPEAEPSPTVPESPALQAGKPESVPEPAGQTTPPPAL